MNEQTLREVQQPALLNYSSKDQETNEKPAQMKIVLQIAANLALYARNSICNHSVDHRTTKVLFAASVGEGINRNGGRAGTIEATPNLGIVVSQLKNCVEYYNREKLSHDALLRQRSALPSISLDANGSE